MALREGCRHLFIATPDNPQLASPTFLCTTFINLPEYEHGVLKDGLDNGRIR
ncbi:MAG: hypothetical protein JRN19_04350 [Nitrososphaerota archaeon]|nr:hypothetical protein [Nitrososphaerota archaeon]